jgi:hypothetical protein
MKNAAPGRAAGDTGRAMSQEHVEIVRGPFVVREATRRTLAQRLLLRFPGLATMLLRFLAGLSLGSPLRRVLLWRSMRDGVEAFNRRDLDAALIGFHPECAVRPPRKFVDAGLMEPRYRGPEGYRAFVASWSDVFGADLRLHPVELIDLGDRTVILAEVPGSGQSSGAPFSQQWAIVDTWQDGRPIVHDQYLGHAEALEAVGLRE